MIHQASRKPLSAHWPLIPPFPATSDPVFSFSVLYHRSTKIVRSALRNRYFDDTNLSEKRGCENAKDLHWLMVLVTWSAGNFRRSLKATPTGKVIHTFFFIQTLTRVLEDHLGRPSWEEQELEASGPDWSLPSMCFLIGLMTVIICWGACCAGDD